MKRIIERMSRSMFTSRLIGAYKRAFDQDDKKLLIRDIVGFSGLMSYDPEIKCDEKEMWMREGRRQMAMHILRHLDMNPIEIIQHQNDAQATGQAIYEDTDEQRGNYL